MSIESIIASASDEDLKNISKIINREITNREFRRVKRDCLKVEHNAPPNFDPEATKKNSESLLSFPTRAHKLTTRYRYFFSMIDQDWSCVYPRETEIGDYYVYAHVDPSAKRFAPGEGYGGDYKGFPFYIGKGIGVRAFDLKRNQGHGKKIKELLEGGWNREEIVHIAFSGLSEQKAYEYESKLIYMFGSIYESERKHATLYNLDIPRTPEFVGEMHYIPTSNEIIELRKNELQEAEES